MKRKLSKKTPVTKLKQENVDNENQINQAAPKKGKKPLPKKKSQTPLQPKLTSAAYTKQGVYRL